MKTLSLLAVFAALSAPGLGQNDECANALPLIFGATAFDTTGATTSMPAWPCAAGGSDLWYRFTAPADATYFFDTCNGTGYDSALEVFSGTCAALVPVECNDDSCGLQSRVTLPNATAGTDYYLRVGGFSSQTGTGTITVTDDNPILNPANGHYYRFVGDPLDWDQADAAAQAMIFQGAQGHLATVADQAEKDFIVSLGGDRPWLGAFQDVSDPAYTEPAGAWKWVTGEPFAYTNWAPGEPNNTGPTGNDENHLEMFATGVWNDIESPNPFTAGYVVEWEPGGPVGMSYCGPAIPNSSGQPGIITGSGTSVVAANNLVLTAAQLPPGQFGYFLCGQTQGFFNPPGSQGIICLAGNIGRFNQVANIIQGPTGSLQPNLNALPVNPPVAGMPGQTWSFQCWFRDNNPGPTSNFTDGLEVLLQ